MIDNKKTKVLFLTTFDIDLPGHAFPLMNSLPKEEYETRLFVLSNKYGNTEYSLLGSGIIFGIYRRLLKVYQLLFVFLKYCIIPIVDKKHSEYCYYSNDFIPSYANIILRKLKDFKPDIISIHWVSMFISSATIRDLYKKTNAKIVYSFIDQQHMMGGCHYAIDCEGFKKECKNCPALIRGNLLSHYQLENKKKNLKQVPVIISGNPCDVRIASEESSLFKSLSHKTLSVLSLSKDILFTPHQLAREKYSIEEGSFVVLLGCSSVLERRKGLVYALEALKLANKRINKMVVLVVGKIKETEMSLFDDFKYISTGYLSLNDLFETFCASNCFLSPTIGDSGPMMVNFAVELGVPVISFKVGIAETVVLHKETGYIANYKNSNDLANGLEYIANLSDEDYSEMCKKCRDIVPKLASSEPWYEQVKKM